MLNSLPISLFVGAVLGFLAGLGIGGGSLLLLWLTMVIGMDSGEAQTVNLLFFIFAAGAVMLFRFAKGEIRRARILPAVLAGCVSAGLCSYISHSLNRELMDKLFGGLLILMGLRELFYRPKKAK